MAFLEIKDLHVEVAGKEILKGCSLSINEGEVHAIMGPNGSGKSTLANVIAGNPVYQVTKGSLTFQGKSQSWGFYGFSISGGIAWRWHSPVFKNSVK